MGKKKNKKKTKLNTFDYSIDSNDPRYSPQIVDDEFKEKVIVPYIMSNDTGGFNVYMIFMSVLFIIADIVMFFVYGIKDVLIFTTGYVAFLTFLILIVKMAPILNVWRIRKQKIYFKVVDFCYFSSDHIHTTKYDYNVPAMVVYERFDYKEGKVLKYRSSFKDTNTKLGNKNNRKLKKDDKVYKITNEKGTVLMLIGEGTGTIPKDEFKINKVKAVFIRTLINFVKSEIAILLIQFGLTIFFTLIAWFSRPQLIFKYIEWFCIFGEVEGFIEFMVFGTVLPVLLSLFYPMFCFMDVKD